MKPLNWHSHIFVFLTAFVVVVLRKPDVILNPQFWAEDGAVWYATAYNQGIMHSIFLPWSGYFQTISRLVAALAQLFPFSFAPLIFNVTAIIVKLLPIHLLLSSRFAKLVPSLSTRLFMAFLYLAIPNSWEIHANLTTAQWYLALLAFMVIVATPSVTFSWRFFDIGVILLSGLSGPFSVLLMPIASLLWWIRRDNRLLPPVLLMSACALIQLICIFLTVQSRSNTPLGATPELFIKILSGQVFLAALIGRQGYEMIISSSGWFTPLSLVIVLSGIILIIHALLKAPLELRLFIVFAAMILGAALISPVAGDSASQWELLSHPGIGGRYWFMPMLAFITVVVWMLGRSDRSKVYVIMLTAIMFIGVIKDWHHFPFTDLNFKEYAQQLETSSIGSRISIPINPPGWSMTLIKH